VFSDGSTAEFSLDGLPCPSLSRDLLVGLVELIHPHGSVDAAGSVNHYVLAIRNMVRTLAERGFTGGAAELRRPQVAEYWMGATGPREACTRRMLQALDVVTGDLDVKVAELAAGRALARAGLETSSADAPPRSPRPIPWERIWERTVRNGSAAAGSSRHSTGAATCGIDIRQHYLSQPGMGKGSLRIRRLGFESLRAHSAQASPRSAACSGVRSGPMCRLQRSLGNEMGATASTYRG